MMWGDDVVVVNRRPNFIKGKEQQFVVSNTSGNYTVVLTCR